LAAACGMVCAASCAVSGIAVSVKRCRPAVAARASAADHVRPSSDGIRYAGASALSCESLISRLTRGPSTPPDVAVGVWLKTTPESPGTAR